MVSTPDQFAAELLRAAARAATEAKAVTAKGANNIKRDAARYAEQSSGRVATHVPGSINYDDVKMAGPIVATEIGYDRDVTPQAKIANVLEYGSRNNPPHRNLGRAADEEEPRYLAAIAAVGVKLLAT